MQPTSRFLFFHCNSNSVAAEVAGAVPFLYTPLPSQLSFSLFTQARIFRNTDADSLLLPQLTTSSLTNIQFSHPPRRNLEQMVNFSCLPHWLAGLLGEKFFTPCSIHEAVKKNEKNIFCLDCCLSICPHCLSPHHSHRLLQVRRYVYHDVIRLDDAEKLMDCDFVQSYTTNSAKVVFIKERPQSRPFKSSGNTCSTCDRSLQDPYLFCSLSCKISHIVKLEGGISRHLYECEFLPLESCEGIDDAQMTPDSVLETQFPMLSNSSASSASASGNGGGGGCRTMACTAATEFVKKKRTIRIPYRPTCSQTSEIGSVLHKRKGNNPQRSPLY